MQTAMLNDGVVRIYGTSNSAPAGKAPVYVLDATSKEMLRYQQRTVGVKRHYEALQARERVDLLIRVLCRPTISVHDIAVPTLDGKQYEITLIQRIEGSVPPVMDLTLRRLEREYRQAE
ncbi:MAG: hypothetical protein IJ955_10305 [Oscillospiraceae bacterium]|nr:hypothetical protein [Oscillospiraceae bacterium]